MNKSSDFTWYELKKTLQNESSHSSNTSEWLAIKLNRPSSWDILLYTRPF
jgi:hypothetical protein